jgi:hypothetical protein
MDGKTRIVRIELYVVDHEDRGDQDIRVMLDQFEDGMCTVVEMENRFVDWSDDHPLNQIGQNIAAFKELFNK